MPAPSDDPSAPAPPPTLDAAFYKAHGLGNDYLVFEAGEDWTAGPDAVARICHRWRGVGADGIVCLVGRPGGDGPDAWSLRMFNPDGSEFERSGNGLRILATYLASRNEVAPDEVFRVRVGGDEVGMLVHAGDRAGPRDVSVDMGRVRIGPEAVGLIGDAPLEHPELGALDVTPVSVGNPHCVVFGRTLDAGSLAEVGPFLETHERIPEGTNVQLASVEGPGRLRILIWERGVGVTSASGTSSCAAASAAVHRGALEPGSIEVVMEGGELSVEVERDLEVRLRGPVEEICVGRLADGFLRSVRSGRGAAGSGP